MTPGYILSDVLGTKSSRPLRGTSLRKEYVGGNSKGGVKTLLPWQEEAVAYLSGYARTKLVSPTGSGKSVVLSALCGKHYKDGRRCLIVVPRQHLGETYTSFKVLVGGLEYKHKILPTHVYMGTGIQEGCIVENLESWLTGTAASIAVTTTSSFVRAILNLKRKNISTDILSDLFIVLDEAHHANMVEVEGTALYESQDLTEIQNSIGASLSYLVNHSQARLLLASATMFRGDNLPVLMEGASAQFTAEYVRSFADHWDWLGFNSLVCNYIGFDECPIDVVLSCLEKHQDKRYIILLPPKNRRFRRDRPNFVEDLKTALKAKGLNCLDLVLTDEPDQVRKAAKSALKADNEAVARGHDSAYDIILSVDLMREGTDWIPATHVLDLDPSKSRVKSIQTIGRVFRQYTRKFGANVYYTSFFLNLKADPTDEETRNHVDDRTNVLWSILLTAQDLIEPNDFSWYESKKGQRSAPISEALPLILGANEHNVKNSFTSALHHFIVKNGHPTADDVERCAVEATRGVENVNVVAAQDLLVEMWRRTEGPSLMARRKNIDPSLSFDDLHRFAASAIREEGFSKTEHGVGLLTHTAFSNKERFSELDKILTVIKGRVGDTEKAINSHVFGKVENPKGRRALAGIRRAKSNGKTLTKQKSQFVAQGKERK